MPYECFVLRAASLNWTGISSGNNASFNESNDRRHIKVLQTFIKQLRKLASVVLLTELMTK